MLYLPAYLLYLFGKEVLTKLAPEVQKLAKGTMQKENCLSYPDEVAIEDSLINVKLDQLVDIKELSILLTKLNFTIEVDGLSLGIIDAKVFCESKVEFADMPDKVMTNTWEDIEKDAYLLENKKEMYQLLDTKKDY